MNSEFYKKTRLEMLNGDKPKACMRCYDEEKLGIRSKRIEETEKLGFTEDMAKAATDSDGKIPVNLRFVELRLGNLCNLKCRTCNPISSTSWAVPYQKLQQEFSFVTNYGLKINSHWTESDEFYDDLFNHSHDLELIYINGGEPTLVEKHWRYLEELIKRGYNKKITLWYNINMTNLPDKLIDLWSEFKTVQVTCSIDDLYERNDYIRAGSKWDTVLSNLDKIQSYNWINSSVCQTISWLNVYYVNDFIKFMRDRNLHVHMNYVYDPNFLSINVIPDEVKDSIIDRCKDLHDWEINSLIGQLKKPENKELFNNGIKYNKWLDNNNRTSFSQVFSAWHEKLKPYYENV